MSIESIEYGVDVVVASRFEGRHRWHVAEKELWILDLDAFGAAFGDEGDDGPGDASERFGIAVLDRDAAPGFFAGMARFEVGTADLAEHFFANADLESWDDSAHLLPALFVDFDARRLVSAFPEATRFERWVPQGWTGSVGRCWEDVPAEHRYWVREGVDWLTAMVDGLR